VRRANRLQEILYLYTISEMITNIIRKLADDLQQALSEKQHSEISLVAVMISSTPQQVNIRFGACCGSDGLNRWFSMVIRWKRV